MPVYFKAVEEVPPGELLAHRFGFIWAGLALFSAESIFVRHRVEDEAPLAPSPTATFGPINQHDSRIV